MINNIDGLILAAGRSKRMGCEDKLKSILHDKTLLEHVIDRLEPQVASCLSMLIQTSVPSNLSLLLAIM